MARTAAFHDIAGKRAFISGGGSGIGAALTEGFLAQGARVAFVQRSDASEFCDRMEAAYGERPLFLPCDVTDIGALRAAIAEAKDRIGPVEILVNNAANDDRHALADLEPADWDALQNVNLRHHFFAAQAVAEDMKAAGGGAIVNFTSISYMTGMGEFHAYTAAKAGITALTRSLARELGPHGIRVNAVAPGWVLTERQLRLWATPEGLAAHLDRQCLKRHMKPEDMVAPTLFLASDASAMMTGQVMAVDGGVVVSG